MEIEFQKNNLKPGDPGFVYDKQVDFSKKGGQKIDDGWDDDDDDNVDDYFDDDF